MSVDDTGERWYLRGASLLSLTALDRTKGFFTLHVIHNGYQSFRYRYIGSGRCGKADSRSSQLDETIGPSSRSGMAILKAASELLAMTAGVLFLSQTRG
jgi:hypothetical protein